MEQYGKVLKRLDDERVLVMVRRHSACRNCGGCGGAMKGGVSNEAFVEAHDLLGVPRGAEVRLETETKNVLFSAFLLYLFPLLGLLFGLLGGRQIALYAGLPGDPDLWGLALGVGVMAAIYVYLRKLEKKMKESGRFEIRVTEVMNSGN